MNNIKKKITLLFACMCLATFGSSLLAQGAASTQFKGVIKDEFGSPLYGAIIKSENGQNEYITNSDGSYDITVKDGSRKFTVSYLGYKDAIINLDNQSEDEIDVELKFDSNKSDDIIQMGYTEQSRNSITGAVATVKGSQLAKSPVANLSMTFAGNLLGLSTLEYNSELSRSGVYAYIRGMHSQNSTNYPLVIIDGIICPNSNYEYITPDEIESVTILKDASTTALYGIQGSNGILSIKTKRGNVGKAKVGVHFDQSFQQMTRKPEFQNSWSYAEMRNQAGYNDGLGLYSQFSQDAVEKYRTGGDLLFPNNNYYDMFVDDITSMERVGVNVSGGSNIVKYYTNLNYMHQTSPFKTVDEQGRDYNAKPKNDWINFRSNLDIKVNNYLSGFLRLSGNIKSEKRAGAANQYIYNHIFNLPPTMYGPLTPTVTDENVEGYNYSNQVVTHDNESDPVYGLLNRSGYGNDVVTNVIAQAGMNLDMSFLTKGLSLGGMFAYQTNNVHTTNTYQSFSRWVLSNDGTFKQKGSDENTALVYTKGSSFYYNMNVLGHLKYNRKFGDHSVDAMAYYFYMQRESEANGNSNTILPYRRASYGLDVTYGYKDRYFLKGDLGYSGSDAFSSEHRFTTTPAISAAWVISKEDFLADVKTLSYLKLRASYGISGNDNFGSFGATRFLYMDNITTGSYDGMLGNPEIAAEKMKMWNYGIDLGLFNALNVTFDYFDEKCDNMLVSSEGYVPIYQGTLLGYYPVINTGKMTNKGFELGVNYNHKINKDWQAMLGFTFAQNKNKIVSANESPYSSDYAYPYRTEGFAYGQQWGYLIDYSNGNGMFNMQSEIQNAPVYSMGTPRLGDFMYKDLNKDGTIDEKDKAPIGYSSIPQQYYTISGGFNYKNFEFSFMFQGTGKSSTTLSGLGVYEYSSQGFFTDMHEKAWTEERFLNDEKIEAPALALSQSTSHVSNDYYNVNTSYLRLRNVELAYTLPLHISSKIYANSIRFSLNAQNLFTIDHMPTKYIDPETSTISLFQPYRVYNIGVSLNF